MKTTLILTALLTFAALAVAPTGQAHVVPYRDLGEKCVTVYDFPDLGYQICVNLEDSECTVYEYRTTIIGREKTCIYPGPRESAGPVI